MRAIVMAVGLSAVALAACSTVVEGPGAPADQADLTGTEAVIQADVRGTAAAFVDAYAAAGQDRASALRGLVAGRTLPAWAHWMGVQNEQFPGTIVGGATLAVVGPAHGASLVDVTTDDRFVREVDLVAQVDLQATPTQGEPIPLTWVLDGPMLFVTDPRGDWKVTDFHRDGIPMSVIFQVVDEVDLADGSRLRVSLDSFVAVPTWQFNLVVAVERGSPIALSAGGVSLVNGAGDVVEEAGEVTEGLSSIESGAPAEGVVAFRARSDATGLLLRLEFQSLGGADDVPAVEIPLEGVIQPLPIADPSASPSVGP